MKIILAYIISPRIRPFNNRSADFNQWLPKGLSAVTENGPSITGDGLRSQAAHKLCLMIWPPMYLNTVGNRPNIFHLLPITDKLYGNWQTLMSNLERFTESSSSSLSITLQPQTAKQPQHNDYYSTAGVYPKDLNYEFRSIYFIMIAINESSVNI